MTLFKALVLGLTALTAAPAFAAPPIREDTPIAQILERPEFSGFGQYLFPSEFGDPASLRLNEAGRLLIWHNDVNASTSANVLNVLSERASQGEKVWYDLGNGRGLFYFRGKKGTPFAVICAGGGFAYVGSIHESLPHALELAKRGFNAFALHYRTGGAQNACEDLAAALTFIFAHADELGVSTRGYSLWGGSAGARMAAYLGSRGAAAFGGAQLPRPAAVIMQYTGHSEYTRGDVPEFAVIGTDDAIASPSVMKRRVDALNALGIPSEFHLYRGVRHGFGLGIGTAAEGWFDKAVTFWQDQIR